MRHIFKIRYHTRVPICLRSFSSDPYAPEYKNKSGKVDNNANYGYDDFLRYSHS
jgi:hypothetical protein